MAAKRKASVSEANDFYGVDGSLALAPEPIYYGNAVPAYEPDHEPENEPEKTPLKKPEHRQVRSIGTDPERLKSKLTFALFCAVVVAGLLILVAGYSYNYTKKRALSNAEYDLEQARQVTEKMEKAASADYTVDELYDYAKIELGMMSPKSNDIITITLDQGSYTSDSIELDTSGGQWVTFHWFEH